MLTFVFLGICLFAKLCFNVAQTDIAGTSSFDPKIYNGYPAEISNTKYQVSIRLKQLDSFIFGLGHICGGSLISTKVVLTAAHCTKSNSDVGLNETQLVVVMGTLVRNIKDNNTLVYNIKNYTSHQNYDRKTISFDIALLFLDGEVPANHPTVQPIDLINFPVVDGTMCQVSGWGYTEEKVASDKLQSVDVPIINMSLCNRGYEGKILVIGKLCAGYMKGGKDACGGDSGGPLVCNKKLTGIVSFGEGCGKVNKPGIYTDVLFFKSWIEEHGFNQTNNHNNASEKKVSFLFIGLLTLISIFIIRVT